MVPLVGRGVTVPMHKAATAGYAVSPALDFDAASAQLVLGINSSYIAASEYLVWSMWLKPAAIGTAMKMLAGQANTMYAQLNVSGNVLVHIRETGTLAVLYATTLGDALSAGDWAHVLIAADTTQGSTGRIAIAQDGSLTGAADLGGSGSELFDWPRTQWGFGAAVNAANPWDGCMQELYMNTKESILTGGTLAQADIDKFYNGGVPPDLLDVLGTQPDVYLRDDDWLTNYGTHVFDTSLAQVNGPIAACSDTP